MVKANHYKISSFPDGTPLIKKDLTINYLNVISIVWTFESMAELPTVIMIAKDAKDNGAEVELFMPYIPNARMDRAYHDEDVLGYVQWAAAASGNPNLKALISVVCAGSSFVDLPRRGGSFTSGMLAWAFAVSQKTFHPELMERDDWEKVLNIRPLTDLPKKALGYDVPFITRWLEPSDYNDFWRMSNWQERSVGAQPQAQECLA